MKKDRKPRFRSPSTTTFRLRLAFLNLGDLVGHEPVRLPVNRLGRLLVGGLNEAEDLSRVPVEPVPVVLDPVLVLDLLVLPVGVGHGVGGQPFDAPVMVHEHRYPGHPPSVSLVPSAKHGTTRSNHTPRTERNYTKPGRIVSGRG